MLVERFYVELLYSLTHSLTHSPVVEAVNQQLAVLNGLAERLSRRLQSIGGDVKMKAGECQQSFLA